MFYHFRQNNSGGYFARQCGRYTIAPSVIIEAPDADAANQRAEEMGLFRMLYCACCGQRFRRVESCDGVETLALYGVPCIPTEDAHDTIVYFADGTCSYHVTEW